MRNYVNLTALLNDYTVKDLRCKVYAGKSFALIKNKLKFILSDTNGNLPDYFKIIYCDNTTKKSILAIIYHNVTIYNMCKRLGTDDYDVNTAAYIAATTPLKRWNSTFTGYLGSLVDEELLIRDYPHRSKWLQDVFINDFSRGALMYAKVGTTFNNAYKYDFKSYYPAIMLNNKPLQYYYNRDNRRKSSISLLHVHVDKIRAKDPCLTPLYVTNSMKSNTSVIGRNVKQHSGGLVYAEDYDFWFYNFSKELIFDAYDIQGAKVLQVFDVVLENEHHALKPMREQLLSLFNIKENYKDSPNYTGSKVTLNRLAHGFLLTCYNDKEDKKKKIPRNYKLPADIGVFNVAWGQAYLYNIMKHVVGLEHCIAVNTDCIVVDKEMNELTKINAILDSNKHYGNLGFLMFEEKYEKIKYIGLNTSVFIKDGKLDAKIPGIRKEDKEFFLKGKTFDEITPESIIRVTTGNNMTENASSIVINKTHEYISIRKNAERYKPWRHNMGDEYYDLEEPN